MEDVRIKLSALWAGRMLTGLQGDVLRFMEPGMMQQRSHQFCRGLINLLDELIATWISPWDQVLVNSSGQKSM